MSRSGVSLQRNAVAFTSVYAQGGHGRTPLLRHVADRYGCDIGPGWDTFVVIRCVWSQSQSTCSTTVAISLFC